MSKDFDITSRASAYVVAENQQGEHFIVQVKVDVQSVTDAEPSLTDGSPQFHVTLGTSANIAPCSKKNEISVYPLQLPPLSISVESSTDGKVYENSFEISLLSLQLDGSISNPLNIPQPTIQFHILPNPTFQVIDRQIKSFYCSYCNKPHPISWNTKEHIIPEALNNKKYILPFCCKHVNNYMAHSFEKRVLQYDLIKEILLLVTPPQKPIFRGNFKDSPYGVISRRILPTGKIELTEQIQKFETNTVKVNVKDKSGNIHTCDLTLPFSIVNRVVVPDSMANVRKRYAEQAKKQLSDYFIELDKNNSINPEFEKFLEEVDATFKYNPDIQIDEEKEHQEPKVLGRDLQEHITFDNEALIKLFLKIAWTHAAKQYGRERLSNPTSNWILQYLTEGHISDSYLTSKYPYLFTEPIDIDGDSFIFWKKGITDTGLIIEDIEDTQDKNDLFRLLKFNYDKNELSKQFIEFKTIEVFDDALRTRVNEFRTHRLALKNMSFGSNQATVCEIQLFGGLLEASVILSESPISELRPEDICINF
jgi:hypothetical protein